MFIHLFKKLLIFYQVICIFAVECFKLCVVQQAVKRTVCKFIFLYVASHHLNNSSNGNS